MADRPPTGGGVAAGGVNSQRGRLKKLRNRAALPDGNDVGAAAGGGWKKKRKKGKFKGGEDGRMTSGITSHAEWDELRGLLPSSSGEGPAGGGDVAAAPAPAAVGPSILRADGAREADPARWRQCEGNDHRDLILNLLFHNGSGGGRQQQQKQQSKKWKKRARSGSENEDKRRRDDNPPPIPGWARIHNPATLGGLAVIEVSIDAVKNGDGKEPLADSSAMSLQFMPSQWVDVAKKPTSAQEVDRLVMENGGKVDEGDATNGEGTSSVWESLLSPPGLNGRRALPLRTRLFQGPKPQTVSQALLYMDPPPPPKRRLKPDGAESERAVGRDPAELLGPLVLTRKQMRKEGYPRIPIEDPIKEAKRARKGIKEPPVDEDKEAAREEVRKLAQSLRERCQRIEEDSEDCRGKDGLLSLLPEEAVQLVGRLAERDVVDGRSGSDCSDGGGAGNEEGSNPEKNGGKGASDDNDGGSVEEFFVSTFASACNGAKDARRRKVYALDCEMVRTSSPNLELARVTLLLHSPSPADPDRYVVILDSLVKPHRPVLDYLTQYSGITAKIMEKVETRIEQVQLAILGQVGSDDIVVGHSAENDLRALRVVHDTVVDTASLFRTGEGRKHSLKHLSAALLRRQIQRRGQGDAASSATEGHCSEEDAAAALSLAVRRATIGPDFRLAEKSKKKSVLEAVSEARRGSGSDGSNGGLGAGGGGGAGPSTFVARDGGATACIGPGDWLKEHVAGDGRRTDAHALTCESITSDTSEAILAWLRSKERRAGLLWAHLALQLNNDDGDDFHRRIEVIVSDLIENVPSNTVLLFVFQREYKRANHLSLQRTARRNPRSTLRWTDAEEVEWSRAMDACRWCDALWVGMSS